MSDYQTARKYWKVLKGRLAGVSGIGSTCVEAERYAKKRGGRLEIYAQDKMTIMVAISTIRAYVNEIENFNGRGGDVLLYPQFEDGYGLRRFDYSIMFPPLGMAWNKIEEAIYSDKYKRFSGIALPKSNAEWLFAQHQIASLKDNTGRGIIAVSTGTLFNSASEEFREFIINSGYIKCIISLPSKILRNTAMPINLIVFQKQAQYDKRILMIQSEGLFRKDKIHRISDQLDASTVNAIVELYCERLEVTDYSRLVAIEEVIENRYILLPSRYVHTANIDSEMGLFSVNLHKSRNWPKMSDISKAIFRGLNISHLAKENPDGEFQVINYADIQEGEINTYELKRYDVKGKADKYIVRPGDILISCKGAQIKVCVVPEGMCDTLLSICFVGIRPDKSRYLPEFIKQYLESPAGQAYLRARQVGTSIITLRNKDIEEMQIPDIPLEKQIESITRFEAVLSEVEAEMNKLSHRRNQAMWDLYRDMGLEEMLEQKEVRYTVRSNNL